MPGLLDLPAELLLDIIELALSPSRPVVPHNAKRHRECDGIFGSSTCYIDSSTAYKPNALALLLVSRAIHEKTAHCLAKSPRICKFDIALVNAYWFLPTWHFIPTRNGAEPAILDKLEVRLLPCCTEEDRVLQSDWPADDEAGYRLEMMPDEYLRTDGWEVKLLYTIERFFAVGALGKHRDKVRFPTSNEPIPRSLTQINAPEYPANIRVRTLVLDTNTYGDNSVNVALSPDAIPAREVEGLTCLVNEPLYPIDAVNATKVINRMAFYIQRKLELGRAMMQIPWLERVGRIEFCVDGHLVGEIDVSDYMYVDHQGDEPGERELRIRIAETRKKLGL